MVVVIPITIRVPAVTVFVPPAMPAVPTSFAGFVQFLPRALRLSAVPPVMFGGFVHFVVGLGNTALAIAIVFGGRPGRPGECQQAKKCGREYRFTEKLLLSRVQRHVVSILPIVPRLRWGS